MKKMISCLVLAGLITGCLFFLPTLLKAYPPDACGLAYVACLDAAGDNEEMLKECLRALGRCRGYEVVI